MRCFIVIALSAIAISCSESKRDSTWWRNEKTIIELKNKVELEQFRAEAILGTPQVEAATDDSLDAQAIAVEIALLSSRREILENEVLQLAGGWDEHRRNVLNEKRGSVYGISFAEYEPGNGRIYENVTVTAITDCGVAIRHSKGSARLRFNDLNAKDCEFFGLDEQFSQAALQLECEQRFAYEEWVDKGMAKKEAERLAAAEVRKRAENRRLEQRRLAAINKPEPVNTSPLSASFGRLGETRSSSRSTFYYTGSSRFRNSSFNRFTTPGSAIAPAFSTRRGGAARSGIIAVPSSTYSCPTPSFGAP